MVEFQSGSIDVYDTSGRIITQTDSNNNVAHVSYHGLGNTTSTDANNNVTKHRNDEAGNLLQLADPLGDVANNSYDSFRRPRTQADRAGLAVEAIATQPRVAPGNQLEVNASAINRRQC